MHVRTRTVQFLSSLFSEPDRDVHWSGTTARGYSFSASGKLRIGAPLLYQDIMPGTKTRALFAPPWPDFASAGAVQFTDPYAELRWPSYVMLDSVLDISIGNYSQDLAQDVLHHLRSLVGLNLMSQPPLNSLLGQKVSVPGYRWSYWTLDLDFVGNPRPNPNGGYLYSEPGEPIGPGFASIENLEWFPRAMRTGLESDEQLSNFPDIDDFEYNRRMAVVWSQAFSLSNRANATADAEIISKRVQEIRKHWNSFNELKDADGHLTRHDSKGAVRSAASAIDAALRFHCVEWGVSFPTNAISFDDKIEDILIKSKRPSYRAVNPNGSMAVLHLYRARNAMQREMSFILTSRVTRKSVLIWQ